MANKLHVLKAKSAWKKIDIPTGDDFTDLIEFQELSDYEFLEESGTTTSTTTSAAPTVNGSTPASEGESQKKKKKKRRKKKKNGEQKQAVSSASPSEMMDDGEPSSVQESPDDVMGSWKELGVSPVLLQALREEGFTEPTPIQAQAVPHAILHRLDIIGAAQTGSGKTLAFGLPILEHILKNPRDADEQKEGPQALILLPTRELALQVCKHLKSAARHTDIQVVTVVGGMAPQKQMRLLKRHPHIVVATPGRLWELIEEGENFLQNLHTVEQFVLDEADRMIEKGHFEELHKIIGLLQSGGKRQHYIFSATLTLDHSGPHRPMKKKRKKEAKDAKQKLEELVQELGIQEKPKVIDLTHKDVTVDSLTETRINCPLTEKDLYLYYILRKYGGRTLVFCNSKDCIRRLVSVFTLLHRNPLPLHSDMHQRQRLKNLDRFAERETSLLLASDVAARGLDIKGVDHVVHYQVPFTIENYVHRSGRTARACSEGVSVVLVSPDEITMYRNIVKMKQGEDLPPFPVDADVLRTLKTHVDLAKKIDTEQHRLRKEEVNSNWMQKAADEMDIELDDDLLPQGDSNQRQQQKSKLKQQKLQLEQLLKQPVLPATFSGRYPTKAGHLVVPKTFTKGDAVKDCRKRRRDE
ncbi:ATP-dependent RNA helicase DDX24-like [Babylonia areolata]|uniref:ATP-dependent RNA helicase DDX24-like n=1 Tax=Babylonia areolata TaxID=304850 RepID=UPI003FCF0645